MSLRSLLPILALTPLALSLAACSQETEDIDDQDEAIVGIGDLKVLEKELGLTKDVKDKRGNYKRSNATIKKGACYASTRGTLDGSYEFGLVRYTNATAIVRNKAVGSASGEKRPILCMDLDVDGAAPQNVSRAQLDAMVRFHLGRARTLTPSASGGATSTVPFERGSFVVGEEQDKTKDSLDNPRWNKRQFLGIKVAGVKTTLDPAIVSLAYRFAWNKAVATDTFDIAGDPVGNFLSAEVDAENNEHIHFAKIDAHRIAITEAGRDYDALVITPKLGANGKVLDKALATCKREVDDTGAALEKFSCTGLGSPNPTPSKVTEAAIDPSAVTSKIVPAKSIRGISLGFSKEKVLALLGTPDSIETYPPIAPYGYITQFEYGLTRIELEEDGKVVGIVTQSPKVKTANGIGYGSKTAALKAKVPGLDCSKEYMCTLGGGKAGEPVTAFYVATGLVENTTLFYFGAEGFIGE